MKLVTFTVDTGFGGSERLGVLGDRGNVLDLNGAYSLTLAVRDDHPRCYEIADALVPPDLLEFLRGGEFSYRAAVDAIAYLGKDAEDPATEGAEGEPIVYVADDVEMLAPLPRPMAIKGARLVGGPGGNGNGVQHGEELSFYRANADAVETTGMDIAIPSYAESLDYDVQVACIVGAEGRDLDRRQAASCIAGYVLLNDLTALGKGGLPLAGPMSALESSDFEMSNLFGPYMVTSDEFNPRGGSTAIASVEGDEWGRSTTASIKHDFATILMHLSQIEPLRVGDVVASGPMGVANGRELGRVIAPGSLVDIEIEGLGALSNRLVRL